jgi:hypothetical protein
MHHAGFDEMFFTKQYIRGLKDEVRVMVESQMPPTVIKAAALAKIQQQQAERTSSKTSLQDPTDSLISQNKT